MNTKPESERCVVMLNIRLAPPENEAFQQIAAQLHTTRSELLRKIIRELIGQGPDLLANDLRIMDQAAYQLGCVGRNLNQLLRTIYTGKVTSTQDQKVLIEALRDRVETLAEEMGQVIQRSYERWVDQETFKR